MINIKKEKYDNILGYTKKKKKKRKKFSGGSCVDTGKSDLREVRRGAIGTLQEKNFIFLKTNEPFFKACEISKRKTFSVL